MSVLDVFTPDAFGVKAMTDAILKIPFIPGRAGQVAGWQESGIATTSIMLEEKDGVLTFVNPTKRGSPGSSVAKQKRTARTLNVPHYQIDDGINADEVQGIRAFGEESMTQTVMALVNQRLAEFVQQGMDPTLEYQRLGALKGVIVNADASTLYDLFSEFGVTQTTEFNLEANVDNSATGAMRKVCASIVRSVAESLGGRPFSGIHALCGDALWEDLITNKEVVQTYLNQAEASQLRGNIAYEAVDFGGIRWENYRGSINGSAMIHTDKAHIFPVGVPGLFRTVYSPGDWVETVNTLGLPRYARQYPMHNGKGVHLEVQMNALSYCTQPAVLKIARRT